MRLRASLLGLSVVFLVLVGWRPDGLPFVRDPEVVFSDAVISHWPAALFLHQSVVENRVFPLWRETIMAGQPFAANPLNKVAYPPQWLALILTPALHLNLLILLHGLIAAVGMWRWGQQLGLEPWLAALAALTYAFSPRLVGHLAAGHLDIVYALAWWPWLMLQTRAVIHGSPPNGRGVLILGILAALVVLADVRVALFGLVCAAGYGLYGLWTVRRADRLFLLVPGGFVVLVLTFAVWAPLLAWQPYLSRVGMTGQEAGVLAFEGTHLIGLLLPGNERDFERIAYVGIVILPLAVLGLFSLRWRRALALGTGLLGAALYAMGMNGPLWPLLVEAVPFLLWFRVPSRAWLILALMLPLLAVFGLQWLMRQVGQVRANPDEKPRRVIVALRLMWAGWAVLNLLALAFAAVTLPEKPLVMLHLVFGGVALAVIALLALYRRLTPHGFVALVAALAVGDVLLYGARWLSWRGPEVWLVPYEPLALTLRAEDPARIYSPTISLPQQAAAAYDLRLLGGIDPFQITGVVQGISAASGVPVEGYSVIVPPLRGIDDDRDLAQANRDALPDAERLAHWGVSHVVSAYPLNAGGLELLTRVSEQYIYRNTLFTQTCPDTASAWPPNAAELPDSQTVARANDLTLTAFAVSGAGWLLAGLLLVAPRVKRAGAR